MDECRLPSILVPYPGPRVESDVQDIALYLRPESNGVLVESTIMRVITSGYRQNTRMVYLANIPGDFVVARRVVERHYRLKIQFARSGKDAFTPQMQRRFERAFGWHLLLTAEAR